MTSTNGQSNGKNGGEKEIDPSIQVRSLSYTFPDGSTGLSDINLDLPAGSRCLLIGANGAGKSTLLRLLSGRRMSPEHTISISGLDPFQSSLEGITYLGTEWVLNPIVRTDISVPVLLSSVGGDFYVSRKEELVRILDIDLAWRMHTVSDGERRRVQLAMGLLRPWTVLLLDEITVDLDLLSRARFLGFLRKETLERKCTVVYATHILDNLQAWPSELVHMSLGRIKRTGSIEHFRGVHEELMGRRRRREDDASFVEESTGNSMLGDLVLEWLKEDLEERGPRSQGRSSEAFAEGVGGYGQEKRPDWK